MSEYEIVPAKRKHALELAPVLRKADREEIWAANRSLPLEGILTAMDHSQRSFAGLADGRTVCLFGHAPLSLASGRACAWLVTAEELPRHATRFLRLSRDYIEAMLHEFPTLVNMVDARNTQAIRWLRWLGFEIRPAVNFGADNLPFHPYRMTRELYEERWA